MCSSTANPSELCCFVRYLVAVLGIVLPHVMQVLSYVYTKHFTVEWQ